MKALNDLLQKHPSVLSTYVSLGFALVDKTVAPLNKFMQHLMVIQGIDPKTEPGAAERKLLEDMLNNVNDEEEFEEDFNFDPALKAFDKTNKKLQHLHLTKEKFKDLTDVSQLGVAPTPLQRTKEATKIFTADGLLNANSLKDALKTLKKYAEELESSDDMPPKLAKARELAQQMVDRGLLDSSTVAFQAQVDEILKFSDDALSSLERVILRHPKTATKISTSRQNVAIGKNKKAKVKSKVTKSFKGCFRRVTDKE